jgi:replicative DNA helicase
MNDTNKIIETEKKLATYSGEDEVITSQENYILLKNRFKNNFICSSGIPTLDELIVGFYRGELNIIGGPSKHGKTLFAQTETCHFAEQKTHSLWFTYEVPSLQFLEQFNPLPGFFMPKTLRANSLDWIQQRIWEAKLKYGLDFVFIDHLHYLCDMNKSSMSLEIGKVMRFLKKIAIRFNISIFLIAHLTKLKLEEEPDSDSFRDSSFVVQECDNAFLIWRLKDKKTGFFGNEAVLKISANRRFGIMGKKIRLKKIGKILGEVTKDYD